MISAENMGKLVRNFKIVLICSAGMIAISACSPKYVSADSLDYGTGYNQGAYSQTGYSNSAYSEDAYAQGSYAQGSYGMQQQNPKSSRYGFSTSETQASLRPACGHNHGHCGFMRVVPVYPIYQIPMEQPAAPTTVVEAPVVEIFEPEPQPYIEPYTEPYIEPIPEPVYTPPVNHWPEPEVEMPSWKPLRK